MFASGEKCLKIYKTAETLLSLENAQKFSKQQKLSSMIILDSNVILKNDLLLRLQPNMSLFLRIKHVLGIPLY